MWFNSRRNEKPHQGLTSYGKSDESRTLRKDRRTGAAWLSSVRSVRSALKWDNERNPHLVLNLSQETAPALAGEEGGADVKSAWSLCLGLHTCYNEGDNGSCERASVSESHKPILSGDWGLQLDPMNAELVVIADQQRRGEYVLASCTHRPSNEQSRKYLNSPSGGEGTFGDER